MSDKSTSEAVFKITIDGNASVATKDIASSARLAAKSITEYENEVKTLGADLRRLKGNSDEVVATKAALKKRIDEAKVSVSALTAELLKQGTSYAAASAAAKKYGAGAAVGKLPNLRAGAAKALGGLGAGAAKALSPATKKLGALFEPVTKAVASKLAPLTSKLSTFGAGAAKALGTAGKAVKEDLSSVLPSASTLLAGVATAAEFAVAGFVALAAALGAGTVALAAFTLVNADAYAKMSRQREALLGTAKDAGNLGDQIGALAGKVPQSTAELNQMSLALSKTRISGKATVSALNAIAQVSGAVDATAGAKIQELITRGDKFGRMSIGAFELQGTGLDFDEVAKEYAKGTKKSVDEARKELRMGIAPIEAGSEALKNAAEKKFGALNLKNAFSLENAPTKFFEQIKELSKDIDLSPITKELQDAFGQLSPEAPLGAGIKQFMATFGSGLVDIAAHSIPVLLEGFTWLVVWGLRLSTVFIKTATDIRNAFNGSDDWFEAGQKAVGALVLGLVKGIAVGTGAVEEAIWSLGKDSIVAFKKVMGIHSPSKVFAKFGEHTTEGYAQGVERGSRRANAAVQGMIDAPEAGAPGGAGSAPITVTVNIHGASTDSAKSMSSPQFLALLSRAIRDSVTSRGLAAAT